LKTAAYKLRSSGKQIETEKARKADVLKISFTINENKVAKQGDKTYYVDKNKLPLFFYRQNVKDGFIYFNYERIWLLLGPIFGLNVLQKREILSRWLEKSYNLVGLKPTTSQANSFVNRWLDPII
jgi:hypothetical protein